MHTNVKPITPLLMILPRKLTHSSKTTDNPNQSFACSTPVVSIYNNECDSVSGNPESMNIGWCH